MNDRETGNRAAVGPTEAPGSVGQLSDHLELLAAMSQDFVSSGDIEASLKRAVEHITDYVDAEGGALFLLDEKGGELRCYACVGPTEITGLTIEADQGIVGRCVQNDRGEIVRDVTQDTGFHGGVDEKTGFTTRSILCAPMTVRNERVGAIEVINKRGGDGLFDPSDLHLLQAMSASAALAIINARMAEALVEQERIARELELAAEIQRSLLPGANDEDAPVAGINHAARTVSGDFYDFFPLDDGRICFNLGDVSGKGMNAALMMAKTASLYRCLGKTITRPGRLLAQINAEICETATRGMFVTMVGGIYDPRTGIAWLANAGHEPPLFHDTDGNFTSLPAEAPPLGISPLLVEGGEYPEVELKLDGGALYIFTDGVTEGYLADGRELGVEGFKALIEEYAERGIAQRLTEVIGRLAREDVALRDDLTLLGIDDAPAAAGRGNRLKGQPGSAAHGIADETGGESLMRLTVPSQPDRLRMVRNAVAEVARYCGCEDAVGRDIVIAVDEACQNVIRHAYGGSPDGEIAVEVRRDGADLVVLVRDFADPIDVSEVKPRDLDDIRPGGLGTHFMQEVMDDVRFMPSPADGGNLLRMTKRLT